MSCPPLPALVLVVVLAVSACGGSGADPSPPAAAGKPAAVRTVPAEGLGIGITEPNPAFFAAEPGAVEFEPWRRRLDGWRPTLYRLLVDWTAYQGEGPEQKPDFEAARDGCQRGIPPCAAWAGLRAQLELVAARQRKHPGAWNLLVVFTGTPAWAARTASGCERPDTEPRSRYPTPAGVEGYGRFVRSVLGLARRAGAEARYWSPWNEPNQGFGFAGQRARCSAAAPSRSIEPYTELAQEMSRVLEAAPGDQELVLGELAGLLKPTPRNTTVAEFVAGLPRELVCATTIWTQHGYVNGSDPAPGALEALDARGCERPHRLWVTETGAGGAKRGRARRGSERRRCEALHRRLEGWHADPRVDLAVQYTVREDDRFPTGLVTTDLARAYPVLDAWLAWGGDRRPADPPPFDPCG